VRINESARFTRLSRLESVGVGLRAGHGDSIILVVSRGCYLTLIIPNIVIDILVQGFTPLGILLLLFGFELSNHHDIDGWIGLTELRVSSVSSFLASLDMFLDQASIRVIFIAVS